MDLETRDLCSDISTHCLNRLCWLRSPIVSFFPTQKSQIFVAGSCNSGWVMVDWRITMRGSSTPSKQQREASNTVRTLEFVDLFLFSCLI